MDKILAGIRRFRTQVFQHQQPLFQSLVAGQRPMALFVTCSDSRVVPSLFTQSEPGTLFELQNAGNLVPPYGVDPSSGISATVEYAVAALGVAHIVVCGHDRCGAMTALVSREGLEDLPAVRNWLQQGERTRRLLSERLRDEGPTPSLVREAIELNVLAQLDNLRTHPAVAAALKRRALQLHGWVYDFESGEVRAHEAAQGIFVPLLGEPAAPNPTPSPIGAVA